MIARFTFCILAGAPPSVPLRRMVALRFLGGRPPCAASNGRVVLHAFATIPSGTRSSGSDALTADAAASMPSANRTAGSPRCRADGLPLQPCRPQHSTSSSSAAFCPGLHFRRHVMISAPDPAPPSGVLQKDPQQERRFRCHPPHRNTVQAMRLQIIDGSDHQKFTLCRVALKPRHIALERRVQRNSSLSRALATVTSRPPSGASRSRQGPDDPPRHHRCIGDQPINLLRSSVAVILVYAAC
jgi:hypothetical protein